MTRKVGPIGDEELDGLFGDLAGVPLALCVSGGADSMALMHLIARWLAGARLAERAGGGGVPRVVVLTVDHALRPQSAEEARFVADAAARLGLNCEILRWDGPKPTTGVQEAAREARRMLLLDYLEAEQTALDNVARQDATEAETALYPPRRLVMAHHAEDQAETVLMRLARGSGLEGLAGMRALDRIRREAMPGRPAAFTALVQRPLLGVAKARLLATLRAGGHAWVDDPSNEDERFERVRMRRALAGLGAVGLTAEKIALSARRLGEADSSFSVVPPPRRGLLMAECELAAPAFATPYLAVRSLRYLIRSYGGAARDPELAQLEEFAGVLLDAEARRGCGGLTLGGCKIEFFGLAADCIRVFREGSGAGLGVVPFGECRAIDWDGGRFTVEDRGLPPGAEVGALGLDDWAKLKRRVPLVDGLGWPAAAAATLPVVRRAGEIAAHPGVTGAIAELQRADLLAAWHRQSGRNEHASAVVATWSAAVW